MSSDQDTMPDERLTVSRAEQHSVAASTPERVSDPSGRPDAVLTLKAAPHGALIVSGIAVALLLAGWLLFYFLLFLPRGPIG